MDDHPELYALSTDGNDFTTTATAADCAHMNAIEIDPSDSNYVLSFRHLDAILKVNKVDGSIMWRLGNKDDTFNTTAEQKSSHQHYARFQADGRLMMFDNGNASEATRVITFALDQVNHVVTSFDAVPLGFTRRRWDRRSSWEPIPSSSGSAFTRTARRTSSSSIVRRGITRSN